MGEQGRRNSSGEAGCLPGKGSLHCSASTSGRWGWVGAPLPPLSKGAQAVLTENAGSASWSWDSSEASKVCLCPKWVQAHKKSHLQRAAQRAEWVAGSTVIPGHSERETPQGTHRRARATGDCQPVLTSSSMVQGS